MNQPRQPQGCHPLPFRSYGIGLARALAAGLLMLECEQPGPRQRRGKGKSGSIDAHLAVLAVLRLARVGCRCRAPTATGRHPDARLSRV